MSMRRIDGLSTTLSDLPLAPDSVVSGTPSAWLGSVGEDWGVTVGIWSLSEGVVTDTESDEMFVVIAGRGTVEFDSGETIALAPGVIVRLHEGERTTWTVTETLRKVYIAPA